MTFRETLDRFGNWKHSLWLGGALVLVGAPMMISSTLALRLMGAIFLMMGVAGVVQGFTAKLGRDEAPSYVASPSAELDNERPTTSESRSQRLVLNGALSDPRLLWGGLVVLAVGVLLLLLPASTQVNGTKVGCGTSIIRDNNRANNYDSKYSTYGWSQTLGYQSNSPHPAGWESAYSSCTDRLTVQRWIAWPIVLLGAGLAARGVVNRREQDVAEAVAGARQAGYAGQPAGPMPAAVPQGRAAGPTPEVSPEAVRPPPPVPGAGAPPLAQGAPFAPPAGPPMQLPPPQAAAGWYPSPTTPGLIQWYDGQQWTHHTQPRPPQQ